MIAYIAAALVAVAAILAPSAVGALGLLLFFHLKDKGW